MSVFALFSFDFLANNTLPDDRKYKPVPEPILPGRPELPGLTFF